MDDPVAVRRGGTQHVEVVESTTDDLRPAVGHERGCVVRASKSDDAVASRNELRYECGPDVSRRTGEKNAHDKPLRSDDMI
ncbi:Uncharacterised protein [Mycobacteroides abscessus subsp. abscessus]|nr:Uncharacterised protein [Mycobacteroides abscessus subsp. abscessus]